MQIRKHTYLLNVRLIDLDGGWSWISRRIRSIEDCTELHSAFPTNPFQTTLFMQYFCAIKRSLSKKCFRSFFSFCHFDSWKRLTFWKEDLSSCFSEIWALLSSFEKIKSKWGVECTNGQLGKILLKIAEFLKVWKQYLFSSFNCFFCHKKSLEWRN